jgi:hypothetical protein
MMMTSSVSLEAIEYPKRSPGKLLLPADRFTVFIHAEEEEEEKEEKEEDSDSGWCGVRMGVEGGGGDRGGVCEKRGGDRGGVRGEIKGRRKEEGRWQDLQRLLFRSVTVSAAVCASIK